MKDGNKVNEGTGDGSLFLFKREIVILAEAKKGGYEVNEFKRKISSE